MKSQEIRSGFLDFFKGRGHAVLPSSGLVPKADPSLLFTNAGMVQFKGVFLNEEAAPAPRAATCQKCMRAGGKHNDLENVGRTARHHTFFEMLGNFSFGDYFKDMAIGFAWEFLTKEIGLKKGRLWATVYETDDEAAGLWAKISGLPDERIVRMGAKDNFWSMGETGPCGPCSEILFDQGPDAGCKRPSCAIGCDCDRYLEIWNLVFMQYDRKKDGSLVKLPRPCIDTGMGLERLAAVVQGRLSNYDSDLFKPVIEAIQDVASVRYGADPERDFSIRAIADHARAITFLAGDGVLPGNVGRAYVLRRIIRRALRHGRFLGVKKPFMHGITGRVIELMSGVYPEIASASDIIRRSTLGEEERFIETLERGLELLDEEMRSLKGKNEAIIPGGTVFKLYDTFGFPSDLTSDIVARHGFTVDEEGFLKCMDEQRKAARQSWKSTSGAEGRPSVYRSLVEAGIKSRFVGYRMDAIASRVLCIIKGATAVSSASQGEDVEIITEETPFYGEGGGQAGDTGVIAGTDLEIKVLDSKRPSPELTVHAARIEKGTVSIEDTVELAIDVEKRNSARRNHTATHILHAALRGVLGGHVRQAGSLVTHKSLRFDFNHFAALNRDEIRKIEVIANSAVLGNKEVKTEVLPYAKAVEKGALAFFDEKYGETVRMVSIEGISAELCGGTHVDATGDIGVIKVVSEGSVASGVRRIEAITGEWAVNEFLGVEESLRTCAELLKSSPDAVPERVKRLLIENKELEREIQRLKSSGKKDAASGLISNARRIDGVSALSAVVSVEDIDELRSVADNLRTRLGPSVVVLGASIDGKAVLLAAVTKDLTGRLSAGEIVKRLAPVIGGRGGGKPDLAQAGGPHAEKLSEAVTSAYSVIEEMTATGK
ncbi:MAG: alanine--tRNA ligase [Deltaproteobacteria bacterium]